MICLCELIVRVFVLIMCVCVDVSLFVLVVLLCVVVAQLSCMCVWVVLCDGWCCFCWLLYKLILCFLSSVFRNVGLHVVGLFVYLICVCDCVMWCVSVL